jgi:hypothetical protein
MKKIFNFISDFLEELARLRSRRYQNNHGWY